jgi:hypothetical protein
MSNIITYLEQIQEDILVNRKLLQDLIRILGPVFPQEESSASSSEEIEQALEEGKFTLESNYSFQSDH